MSKIIDIPFNDGQDEGADRFLVPEGRFRVLENCRLSRDGRLEVRPSYTQLTTSTLPTNDGLVAYDLTTHQDNLIAFGAYDTGFSDAHPYEPFVYTDAGWAAQADLSVHMLSPVTELEILFQAPYGIINNNCDIAWTNDKLCFVATDTTASSSSVYVLDCTTNVVIAFLKISSATSSRVVACGNTFVVATRTGTSAVARRFDTTSPASGWSGSTTLVSSIFGNTFGWDLAAIPGSTDFLLSYAKNSDTTMHLASFHSTSGFSSVASISVSSRNGNSAVVSDGTNVVWAFGNGNNVELRSLLVSLASIAAGPTTVLGPSATPATGNIVGSPSLHLERVTGTLQVTVQGSSAGLLGTDDSNWAIYSYVGSHSRVNAGTATNVRMASKTAPMSVDSAFNVGLSLGTVLAGGNTSGTDQSYSTCLQLVEEQQTCAARWNFGIAEKLDGPSTSNSHGRASIATDGAGTYWACASVVDDSTIGTAGVGTLQVVKFKAGSADRRQAVEMQGALYVSGGYTYYYDRGMVAAESGFLDTPTITGATQTTGGSLTLTTAYQYIVVYEWQDTQGRTHRSAPSAPKAITLTSTNNSVILTFSSPRSLRRAALIGDANSVKVAVYRNTADDSVFYRVADTAAAGSSYATLLSVTDTMSDTTAQTRPILYTLSQKPTANVGMQPCRFVAAGRDRLIFGGLPDPYLVQFSQLAFPGEPIENASPNNFAYVARLPQRVTAVAAPGDQYVVFTQDAIYQITGSGPQRNGTGEFDYPHTIFADGGCINWKSVVACSQGTFFQAAADRLMLLSPGGGGVQFVGQPIRDQLESYPNITGACLCTVTQRVVFSCTNDAGDAGALLIYDLRRNVWTVDTVGPVTAVVEYLGRLAYVLGGDVFLEDATIGSGAGALPSVSARTGSLKLFGGSGYGMIEKVILQASYVGGCTLEAFISVDDGSNWSSLGPVDTTTLRSRVTGSALAAGDPITITWIPKTRQVDRFSIRIDMTNGTDTGGARLHMLSLEVDAKEFATRQPANNRR